MKTDYTKMSENVKEEGVAQADSEIVNKLTEESSAVEGEKSTEVNDTEPSSNEPTNEATNETIQSQDEAAIKVVVVNCIRLNVRSRYNFRSNIIRIVSVDDILTVSGKQPADSNWVHIRLDDGTEGYVMGDYIKEV